MKVEEILNLETELGVPVKNIRVLNGHNLVVKVRADDKTKGGIWLPDQHTARSVNNLVVIKGVLIKVSEPYKPFVFKSEHYWHAAYEQTVTKQVPKGKCKKDVVSGLKAGDLIMYNSYNVGKIRVHGLDDELMIVRDIDILATGPADADIELGDFAMTR